MWRVTRRGGCCQAFRKPSESLLPPRSARSVIQNPAHAGKFQIRTRCRRESILALPGKFASAVIVSSDEMERPRATQKTASSSLRHYRMGDGWEKLGRRSTVMLLSLGFLLTMGMLLRRHFYSLLQVIPVRTTCAASSAGIPCCAICRARPCRLALRATTISARPSRRAISSRRSGLGCLEFS